MVLNGGRLTERSNRSDNRRLLILLNASIGLCTGVLLYLLWPILGVSQHFGDRLWSLGLTSWLAFGIYYCLLNPVVEELFWRRYLDTPSPYPTRNDALFAGYHMLVLALFMAWQWLPVVFALLALAAWIWRLTASHRNGTRLIIASHFFADVGIVVVGYLYAVRLRTSEDAVDRSSERAKNLSRDTS